MRFDMTDPLQIADASKEMGKEYFETMNHICSVARALPTFVQVLKSGINVSSLIYQCKVFADENDFYIGPIEKNGLIQGLASMKKVRHVPKWSRINPKHYKHLDGFIMCNNLATNDKAYIVIIKEI